MKPNELKKWMEKNHRDAAYVAERTHVSERTVERFLRGETDPVPAIMDAFKRLVEKPARTYLNSTVV